MKNLLIQPRCPRGGDETRAILRSLQQEHCRSRDIVAFLAWILIIGLGSAVPYQSFAQSCATNPAPLLWEAGNLPPSAPQSQQILGTSSLECNLELPFWFNTNPVNIIYTVKSCPGPALPTAAGQLLTTMYLATPTATGIQNGFTPSTQSLTFTAVTSAACPLYWVTAPPQPQGETCSANCVGDPVNPSLGNVYFSEDDVRFKGAGAIAYRRFYNSADASGVDGVAGWRHSYDRQITSVYQTPSTLYPGAGTTVSPQYSTPAVACTSGFAAIQGSVPGWAGAAASYANGVCTVSKGSIPTAYLPIQSFPVPQSPTSLVEYDVTRDDGQILRYPVQSGVISNPPGVSIRLALTGPGFTVTDDDDNVEAYNRMPLT